VFIAYPHLDFSPDLGVLLLTKNALVTLKNEYNAFVFQGEKMTVFLKKCCNPLNRNCSPKSVLLSAEINLVTLKHLGEIKI